MAPEATVIPDDLEQLRRRFEEFRNTQPGYSRLPDGLWAAAAELARRYGVNATGRALWPEYKGLRKRVEDQERPEAKRKKAEAPNFLEFIAPGGKAVPITRRDTGKP